MPQTELSKRLIEAREGAGLSLYEAAEAMENTSYQTLWHLEGRSKRHKPASGPDIKLKTAMDIVLTYWPAIKAKHLMPAATEIEFVRPGHAL